MPSLPRVDRIKTIYSAAKALNFGWRFTDFLKTPAYNGVSRFTPQLHRITFRFCKQSESSVGIRNFIEHRIIDIANETPSVVVYTQPVRNTNPVIRAEYGNGRVLQLNARNMSMAEIEKDVHLLYSRSGEPVVKLESRQSAAVGSVQVHRVHALLLQGEWTPMTWLPAKMNVAPLPSSEYSTYKTHDQSVTDFILSSKGSY